MSKSSRTKRRHSEEFKREAVKMMTHQGCSQAETARNLGVHVSLLRKWKEKFETDDSGKDLGEDERLELARLRSEVKRLRMERVCSDITHPLSRNVV